MADLFDPLPPLTNDRASQLFVGHQEGDERGEKENKKNTLEEGINMCWA